MVARARAATRDLVVDVVQADAAYLPMLFWNVVMFVDEPRRASAAQLYEFC